MPKVANKTLPQYQVKRMALKDLKDNPANPRTITDDALKGLMASLGRYGLIQPIIWNKRSGLIVGGHQRKKAMEAAGYKDAQVLVVDFDERDEAGALLSLNNEHIQGQWTDAAHDLLLQFEDSYPNEARELLLHDLYTDLTGTETHKKGLTDADDVPEPPKKAISKLGDVWELGDHQLLCGDSLNKQSIDALIHGKKADMVFTDPPYNIDYGNIKHPKFKVRPIANDKMNSGDWMTFCRNTAERICESTDGCVYVCHAPGPDGRVLSMILDANLHPSTTIIWVKDVFTLGRGKYQNQYEPIWFGWGKDGNKFSDRRDLSNVWHVPRPKKSEEHPTMKPVDLVARAIDHGSSRGQTVLDLFGGSGTTLMAAEVADRRSILIELDPKYCDVIIERWQAFTGKKAKRA